MKIVQAVNSMIANKAKITNVLLGRDGELYFLFGNHKWSAGEDSNGYYLRYFPGQEAIEDLANLIPVPWNEPPAAVAYYSEEIKTREATQSFAELYRTVKEKLYNVDMVLDDIIGNDDDDPF